MYQIALPVNLLNYHKLLVPKLLVANLLVNFLTLIQVWYIFNNVKVFKLIQFWYICNNVKVFPTAVFMICFGLVFGIALTI